MRYPTEINIVADAKPALAELIPLLSRKSDRSWRETVESNVAQWWQTIERQAMLSAKPVNPMRVAWELSEPAACRRDRHRRFGLVDQLVCPLLTLGPRCAARCRGRWRPWALPCRMRSVRSSRTPIGPSSHLSVTAQCR